LIQISPRYHDQQLNPLHVHTGLDEANDPYHFGSSLIAEIMNTAGQELGSHTYSHYYTLEPGASVEVFTKDLQEAKKVLNAPTSLVLPRNQYHEGMLAAAYAEGITVARSNPQDWFWQTSAQSSESLWKKVMRTLDHYFPLSKDTSFHVDELIQKPDQPLLLPASRFLRPPGIIDRIFQKRKLVRIKKEMTIAAQKGHVYHLWWHPHNFAVDTRKSFDELSQILTHFQSLKKDYGMESLNMGEIADRKMNQLA